MVAKKTANNTTTTKHHTVSRAKSPTADWDADDESPLSDTAMSLSPDDSLNSRPLSVSISRPQGPACVRRPTLKEILSNSSSPPWTLTAFMAYLSTNHCLETLEFTMDAGRYKKHYIKVVAKAEEKGKAPSGKDWDNIRLLWQRLMEAYIQPNGSREVNLPSEVRDPLLNTDYSSSPPAPETLDTAVSKVYELMEDSVLVPFLNSLSPTIVQPPEMTGRPSYESSTGQSEDKSRWRKNRLSRNSPPPSGSLDGITSPGATSSRKSPTSSLTNAFKGHRFSTSRIAPSTSQPYSATTATFGAEAHFPGLTDDSGEASSSPTGESPMTPPMSPPESELSTSPRNQRDSGAWRKLGRLGQWKPIRKRSQNFKDNYSMP
ncbi:hypothetical protein MBLNU457_3836t1 [Dothideomycetes sp. NU457]